MLYSQGTPKQDDGAGRTSPIVHSRVGLGQVGKRRDLAARHREGVAKGTFLAARFTGVEKSGHFLQGSLPWGRDWLPFSRGASLRGCGKRTFLPQSA